MEVVIGLLILVIFGVGAAIMITRSLPALLTLPLMGFAIAGGVAVLHNLSHNSTVGTITSTDLLQGVVFDGAKMLTEAMVVAFFGGILSFIMQKSGVAESLVKQAAELIGDNPLAVAIFSMLLIASLFMSIGGLGAIIMVAMVVLPMLATVGVPPVVAGSIMLIGISLGGILNPGNWVIYTLPPMSLKLENVQGFAVVVFFLTFLAGLTFICVELYRCGSVRSLRQIFFTLGIGFLVGGGIVTGIVSQSTGAPRKDFGINVFDPAQRGKGVITPLAQGDSALLMSGELSFQRTAASADPLIRINRSALYAKMPDPATQLKTLRFKVRSSAPGNLIVKFQRGEQAEQIELPIPVTSVGKLIAIRIFDQDLKSGMKLSEVDEISIQIRPETNKIVYPLSVTMSGLDFAITQPVSFQFTILRWTVGGALGLIVLLMLMDIRANIRRWRHQVVTVHWYAYLIPIVPLLFIMVFKMPVLPAFLFGFIYAMLATARPGSLSMAIQCMLQGSSSVIPAALLMVGIGILIKSILGPADWELANGGQQWPVTAALAPIVKVVIPTTFLGYVITFSLAAPLALYRGPLNTYGLGFGVAALFVLSGALPIPAIMAMLMLVGQIQGICDPTNTQNVWMANELRVDVQALMLRTLPYIWVMASVGLVVAGFWFVR